MTQTTENPDRLLKWGLGGALFAALCCFTPLLVVVIAGVGLSAFTGWLDYGLFPLMFFSLAVVVQARGLDPAFKASLGSGHLQLFISSVEICALLTDYDAVRMYPTDLVEELFDGAEEQEPLQSHGQHLVGPGIQHIRLGRTPIHRAAPSVQVKKLGDDGQARIADGEDERGRNDPQGNRRQDPEQHGNDHDADRNRPIRARLLTPLAQKPAPQDGERPFPTLTTVSRRRRSSRRSSRSARRSRAASDASSFSTPCPREPHAPPSTPRCGTWRLRIRPRGHRSAWRRRAPSLSESRR